MKTLAQFVKFTGLSHDELVALRRRRFRISMIVYAVMIAGMVDLPGNIAADRNRGMLSKLKSLCTIRSYLRILSN